MKKRLLYILAIIGLVGIFSSCEEDGDKVIFSSNVIPPSLEVVPDLTLQRSNATDTLIFTATPVDPGFSASTVYTLEACISGNDFADVLKIYSGNKVDTIKMSVSELNSMLLDLILSDVQTAVDLRLKALLVVDAGTGAAGTSEDPFEYTSDVLTVNITAYGLPRLDLVDSGMDQNVKSKNGDGNYMFGINVKG